MSLRAALALGSIAGLLYWMGLPGGWGGWPCALASYTPLAIAAARGEKHGLAAGTCMGVVASGLSLSFLPSVLQRYGGVGMGAGTLALAAGAIVTALPFAMIGALAGLATRRGVAVAVSLALGHALIESYMPLPLRWSLAASMVDATALVGIADLVGAPLTGALAVFLGASVGGALWSRDWTPLRWAAGLAAAAATVALLRSPEANGPTLDVAVVQPGSTDHVGIASDLLTLARHRSLAKEAAGRGARLIVGAEGLIPGVLPADRANAELADQPSTSIVGAIVEDRGELRNAAMVVRDSTLIGRHDKHWLVPLSESAPDAIARWLGKTPLSPGHAPRAIDAGVAKVAVAICYEEMIDEALIAPVDEGAELLISLSHDAWFEGFSVAEVQLAHARLRAIEQRRWLLRSSTTGVTAIIDSRGRVTARARAGEAKVVESTVLLARGAPFATRFHAWLRLLPAGVLLLVWLWREYRVRRSVQRSGPVGPEIDSLTAPWH